MDASSKRIWRLSLHDALRTLPFAGQSSTEGGSGYMNLMWQLHGTALRHSERLHCLDVPWLLLTKERNENGWVAALLCIQNY